jgi:enediyne biosynthesis protein CalE5
MLADIKAGSGVLDIVGGIRELAIAAARVVGYRGNVLAVDISSQMLSIAKHRAISLGLQEVIEFSEDEAATFDAVHCRWGLVLMPNLGDSFPNIYQSLVDD